MPSEFDPRATRPGAAESSRVASRGAFEVVWTAGGGPGDGGWDLPERFEPLRDLGDGVAGPVFVVRDAHRAGESVRLEVIANTTASSEAARSALEEALNIATRVESAFVARCLETGRLADGRVFALREHSEGESLAARLAREGALHASHALEIARQVLRGLQDVHEAALVHGGVDGASVWLASRAPKDDANPFGVRVRLLDLGLARSAPAGGPEADLRAVGELLVQMLGPARASEQTAYEAARSLAEAVRAEGAATYASAADLRMAIDALLAKPQRVPARALPPSSSTPRAAEPERSSRALRIALAAAVLGCVGLGWFGWRLRGGVEAAERDVLARTEQARARDAAERAALQTEVERLSASLGQRSSELDAARRSEQAARTELDSASSSSREELERERVALARATVELASERERRALIESQLSQALAKTDSSLRAARALDAVLELLEQGQGAQAHRRASLLESEGVLGVRSSFVSTLAEACAALERFHASHVGGDHAALDIPALDAAAAALALADAERAEFLSESAAWIGLELPAAGPRARATRLGDALERLRRQVAEATAVRDEVHAHEWAAIMDAPGIQDPARAFLHAERFSCQHLDELALRFARELKAWVLVENALDVGRLNTFHQLGEWAERVGRGEVGLPEELASDVALLAHAQRWYDFDPGNDSRLEFPAQPVAAAALPAKSWRAEIALQWRLAQADSAFPLRAGQTALRRSVDPSGRVEWWRDSVDSAESGAWLIRRVRFAEDGVTVLGEGVIRVERKDARFLIAGANVPLLDLRAHGEAVLVARAPLSEVKLAPTALGFGASALESLRSTAQGESCLVYVQGDVRRWCSPRLGLVREETRTPQGLAVSELVGLQ